jgi:hypothetical protein
VERAPPIPRSRPSPAAAAEDETKRVDEVAKEEELPGSEPHPDPIHLLDTARHSSVPPKERGASRMPIYVAATIVIVAVAAALFFVFL